MMPDCAGRHLLVTTGSVRRLAWLGCSNAANAKLAELHGCPIPAARALDSSARHQCRACASVAGIQTRPSGQRRSSGAGKPRHAVYVHNSRSTASLPVDGRSTTPSIVPRRLAVYKIDSVYGLRLSTAVYRVDCRHTTPQGSGCLDSDVLEWMALSSGRWGRRAS